ncbi:hypothetical protein [Legionella micdadei]|uniref:Uncharacterized protein n=1 Tax=Legionella micdadei TaxID=451 RepID=A0A098GEC9_LEGMI|nr:hypothetical protein [Legionella micdadei]ARG98020.1 hypothetical protein B6N58_10305 [Legionella micdadei]ARH00816.1 hypothetical protein B6V88_10525 [Legionella micdadei]KTD30157.1 hypothetical protein Lmic_0338 [Legionella micdadei]NSL18468.1 hypothetical protein [Legionella micdadei]CEG60352.1 exported protein of unknown function [Legionella micdadei]
MKTRISAIIVLFTLIVSSSLLSACQKQSGDSSSYIHSGKGYGGAAGGAGGLGGGGAGGSGGR